MQDTYLCLFQSMELRLVKGYGLQDGIIIDIFVPIITIIDENTQSIYTGLMPMSD